MWSSCQQKRLALIPSHSPKNGIKGPQNPKWLDLALDEEYETF